VDATAGPLAARVDRLPPISMQWRLGLINAVMLAVACSCG